MKGERVAQLELILRSHPEGLRKSEIARRLGVHRSTIGRYIEELAQYNTVTEENNLIKINQVEPEDSLALSVYESLALNLGADMLRNNSDFQNPHLASGLRKIAMSMKSYAPKISSNIVRVADEIDQEVSKKSSNDKYQKSLESLIDAWISGRMVRILQKSGEETELAPYFIGFVEEETSRNPITVTGRLRHTSEIITIDIAQIVSVVVLDETYTIPDNLRVFNKKDKPDAVNQVIDTVKLELQVFEKSALNSFRVLAHGDFQVDKQPDGTYHCIFEAENSIELVLRIIQCQNAVKVLGPVNFKTKFVKILEDILKLYK